MLRKSDKWIPWYFVAFFVGLALIDGVFVTLAVSTQTGVVREQAYEEGLAYNKVIAASEAQQALGWKSTLTLTGDRLEATIADAQHREITGAEAAVHFTRPTQAGYDFSVPLAETATGHYTADINFPLKGQWDATLTASWKQQNYQQRTRILVR